MAEKSYYMGVDVGTGSARVCITDAAGMIKAVESKEIQTWNDKTNFYVRSSFTLAHSLTHSPTHSLTHSLTHSSYSNVTGTIDPRHLGSNLPLQSGRVVAGGHKARPCRRHRLRCHLLAGRPRRADE